MADAFKRLLLATEHGEFDVGAERLAFALALHRARPLAGVLPLVSNAEFEAAAPEQAERADAEAAIRRDRLLSQAASAGVVLDLVIRRGPELDQEIIDEAHRQTSDLIVIRRRGKRGLLANLLVGEMVSKVVARSPCSLLIAPRGARLWQQRVLVGIDPHNPDPALAQVAAGLAADAGIPLRIVCVVGSEGLRSQADRSLGDALMQARTSCPVAHGVVRVGKAHQALADEAAASGADVLVIGRRAREAAGRTGLGATAQKVIGLAECPVLVHVQPGAGQSVIP